MDNFFSKNVVNSTKTSTWEKKEKKLSTFYPQFIDNILAIKMESQKWAKMWITMWIKCGYLFFLEKTYCK